MVRLLINLLPHKFWAWKRFWQKLVIVKVLVNGIFFIKRSVLCGTF